jgi:hypothetical protein
MNDEFCERSVQKEIERLRLADKAALCILNEDAVQRRTAWFEENKHRFDFISNDLLDSAYRLLLARFDIAADQAPIAFKNDQKIIFHSQNFCPTLEACKILGLDTRFVCRHLNEDATNRLVQQIDPRLRFSRNYEKLRPYVAYCEEMICLDSCTEKSKECNA